METNRWLLAQILACNALFLAQASSADISYLDMSIEQLQKVEVHGVSKKKELIADAPAAVYAVTSSDIEMSGVTNIPDALRMVPGVEVARADSNSWAISIRGFNSLLSNKLLVMIDGRTIYNPVFGGTLWEAHQLMMENIERIEVIRGPGGALWGTNAVNGVINIITKHSGDTQGTLISGVAGNEKKGIVNARHGGTFGRDGSYRVYAKGFKYDESARARPDGQDPNEDTYDEWDGFRTGFRMDWNNEFMLKGNAYRTNAQQRRPDYSLTPPFMPIKNQTLIYEGVNLQGEWTRKHDDGSQLTVQSYFAWTKRDEPFNFVDKRSALDLEVQYNFSPSLRHEMIAGGGIRVVSDDRPGYNSVTFSPQEDRRNVYNVFFQDKVTLAPDAWFLTLGAKVENNEFSDYEVQPNVRLQWHINENSMLWSSMSHASRQPTPIERQLTSTLAASEGLRIAFVPNSEFKAEKVTAYEIGYRNQLTPSLSVDVASFYNEYDELATVTMDDPVFVDNGIDPPHTLVPVRFTNTMEGYTLGLEAVVGWRIHPELYVCADYSYLDMSLSSDEQGVAGPSPRHQLGTRAYWDIREDWMLGVSAKYIDELPEDDVDSYVRLDINVATQLSESLQFNLVGQNLLESSHREFSLPDDINAGEIERSIFAKLSWEF